MVKWHFESTRGLGVEKFVTCCRFSKSKLALRAVLVVCTHIYSADSHFLSASLTLSLPAPSFLGLADAASHVQLCNPFASEKNACKHK